RRLAAVDVVVGVHRRLAAQRLARQLAGAVRDDLVDVHVRLGARAGLPYDEREVVVEVAGEDLVADARDEVGLVAPEPRELGVPLRGGPLEHGEAADHLAGHPLPADLEVLARALGLGPPVAVGGDPHLAERVLLYPVLHAVMLLAAAPRPGRPRGVADYRSGPSSHRHSAAEQTSR